MEKTHSRLERKLLLTWLIVPCIILWFTTNYLIGTFRQPDWANAKTQLTNDLSSVPAASAKTTIPKIPSYNWNGTGLVTLWFDDAWLSQYTVAYPMVEQYGYKAALAVPTRLVGYDAYMGWAQIKRLQGKGWEITSHTRTHDCNVYKEDVKTLEAELGGAQEDLKKIGLQSDHFVSPCGVFSPLMKQIAEKYYLSFRTSEPGYNPLPVTDPYYLLVQIMKNTVTLQTVKTWIADAKRDHTWLILLVHQIDEPNAEYSITTTMLHNILEDIKSEDIPVVLPTQALELEGAGTIASGSASMATPAVQTVQSEIHE